MKYIFTGLFLMAASLLGGCRSAGNTDSLPAVSPFSAARYAGTWHEIARLPHSFERGLVEVTAEYTLRPDGKIEVVNSGFRNGKKAVHPRFCRVQRSSRCRGTAGMFLLAVLRRL